MKDKKGIGSNSLTKRRSTLNKSTRNRFQQERKVLAISAGTKSLSEHGTWKTCDTNIGTVAPARDYGFIRMAGAVRSVFGAGERPTEGPAAPRCSGNMESTGGVHTGYSS